MDKHEMVIAGKNYISKKVDGFDAVLYRYIPTGDYYWYMVSFDYMRQGKVDPKEVDEMIAFAEDRLALWNSATVNY